MFRTPERAQPAADARVDGSRVLDAAVARQFRQKANRFETAGPRTRTVITSPATGRGSVRFASLRGRNRAGAAPAPFGVHDRAFAGVGRRVVIRGLCRRRGARSPDAGDNPRRRHEPAVDLRRRRVGDAHAGRLRARRDRLHAGKERRAHDGYERRDLRHRVHGVLRRRVRADVRRLFVHGLVRLRQGNRRSLGRQRQLGVPLARPVAHVGQGLGSRGTCVLLLHGRVHGRDRDDPDRRDGRTVEVEQLRRVGLLLRRDLLPAVRFVDLGWRLAREARCERGPRPWLRRLCGIRCRAHDGRHRRARGCDGARTAHRQVSKGRHPERDSWSQHPDGVARRHHLVVRMVRLQRRVDPRRDRHALCSDHREHHRSRPRSAPSSRCSTS